MPEFYIWNILLINHLGKIGEKRLLVFFTPEGAKFALMHVAFLHVGSLDVIFDSEQKTKALIRLDQLEGQSELLMFVCNNEIFTLQCPYYIIYNSKQSQKSGFCECLDRIYHMTLLLFI